MSAFPVEHILVILRMACAREQTTFTRRGMDTLDEEIDDRYKPIEENISVKYLDEHVLKPVSVANEKGYKTVSLGKGKLNKLCDFIGFRDYQGFCDAWAQIGKFVNPRGLNEKKSAFKCIYEHTEEGSVSKQCNGAQYPEQNLNLASPLLLNATNVNGLKDVLSSETGIIIMGKEWLKDELVSPLTKWLLNKPDEGTLCPVWNVHVKEVKKHLPTVPVDIILPSEPYFRLAFQYLQYYIEQAGQHSKDLHQGQSIINITDSGAVFTGNPNITGKYISSRDMTINIKEHSDE